MGSGNGSDFQKVIIGTIAAVSGIVDIGSPQQGVSVVQLSGVWAGTLIVEGSNDGVIFYPVLVLNDSTNLLVPGITANSTYTCLTNGYQFVQVRASAWTSGTATLTVWGAEVTSLAVSVDFLRGGTDASIIGNALDRLKVIDGLRDGGANNVLAMTTANTAYEAKSGALRLTNRKSLVITALNDMYWGYNNTVTTASGTPLANGQQIVFAIDPDSTFQVWLVSATASAAARIAEST